MEETSISPEPVNEEQRLNPWIYMWVRPRATIQQIIDTDPTRLVIVLAMIGGISETLDRASWRSAGDTLPMEAIFGIALVLGPVAGIIKLYLAGALTSWTGRWIGGKATSKEVRAAMAWSSVPVIWILWLWIPEVLVFGEELFTTETPMLDASPVKASLIIGVALFEFTVGIWSLVVYFKALGQVQGFSAWKALLNVLLVILIVMVPIVLIVVVLISASM